MDILTHTLSGVAVATCVAAWADRRRGADSLKYISSKSCSGGQSNARNGDYIHDSIPTEESAGGRCTSVRGKQPNSLRILLCGALGGALPDIDAISMWSRFDATFGQLFGLSHSGREIYSAKFWYSHHAFFHSIFASLLLGVLLLAIVFLFRRRPQWRGVGFGAFFKTKIGLFAAFVLGFWAHLLGDLPTPSSSWGGIAALWPSGHYFGGTGAVWWWNNYDIFLIIACCIFINIGVLIVARYIKLRSLLLSGSVVVLAFVFILVQIGSRKFDFKSNNNITYAQFEQASKKEQQRILCPRLYRAMERLDSALRINF